MAAQVHASGLGCQTSRTTFRLRAALRHPSNPILRLAALRSRNSQQLTFDGRFLTTTDGNTIRFWDVGALSEIKQHKVSYPVEAASYCPAKGKFACGGGDMWVRLHTFEDGAELECNRGHHGPVHTVRFGPEGKEYASGSEDGTIRIW